MIALVMKRLARLQAGRPALKRCFALRAGLVSLFSFCLAVGFLSSRSFGSRMIELSESWEYRPAGRYMWHDACVPGCIHTDLMADGIIGDPYYRSNERDVQWIEEVDWEYRTVFQADSAFVHHDVLELCFDGLDTYADVYLNDSLVISADNMFIKWKVPCKGMIRAGPNTVRVYFHSPVKKAEEIFQALGREYPGGSKVVTRKAGYHYGWDWGPRLVTCGIWRPAYVRAWDKGRIDGIQFVVDEITDGAARGRAIFDIRAASGYRASLKLNEEDDISHGEAEIVLQPGANCIELPFEIENPQLWWTNGLGESHLYELQGMLSAGGETISVMNEFVGLRRVEVVEEPDEQGSSFFVRLNGVPVFMKGANYIPADNFLARVKPGRYRRIVVDAAEANMNMLRVWGGGIYEHEHFYDQCDRNGILVWQDFMFACAMYPGDPEFLANVEREAVQAVKRLRNHPCIALWCGNNEIDEAWHNWGWQRQYGISPADSAEMWNGYVRLFHELLPAIVAEHDSGRFYWPSSPKYGRADPRSLTEGDSHYWGVWHDGEPFEVFDGKTGRFMSEYGFQSFPAWETIEGFTLEGDREIESGVMLSHQKHPRGNELIRTYMELSYEIPEDFELFVYLSQVLQAEGIKIAIEAHRRAMPRCMGTLYWQLNDCWPVVSWSSVDYHGRWKALHYYVKRAYGDVLVSTVEDEDSLDVYLVSDRLSAFDGVLKLKLADFFGAVIREWEVEVVARPNESTRLFSETTADILGRAKKDRVVFIAELLDGERLLSRSLHYFFPPKHLDLPVPMITKVVQADADGYVIELSSDRLARNVALGIDRAKGSFTDNYFDMLPGETKRVRFVTREEVPEFEERLEVRSLTDIY